MSPLVSICIPAYNAERTIAETIRSVLLQTYTNFVVHVLDNASTDKTTAIVESFHDQRISLHVAEHTTDAETNLTRCLQTGHGRYTAVYHADDVYDPTILEKQVAFLESHHDAGGVLSFATLLDRSSKPTKTFLAPPCLRMKRGEARSFDAATLLKGVLQHGNFLFCPSAMIRTSVCVDSLKTWRGDLFKSSADLDVWLRIADISRLGLINEPLLFYRISDTQWTATYSKTRTRRSHFLSVLDYWTQTPRMADALNQRDRNNYHKLEMKDDIALVLNQLRHNNHREAKNLYDDNVRLLTFLRLGSVVDLKFLILGCALKLMLAPVVGNGFKQLLLPRLGHVRI